MMYALLFLGMLPALFLSDIFSPSDAVTAGDDPDDTGEGVDLVGNGNMLDLLDPVETDPTPTDPVDDGGTDPLQPIVDDETPIPPGGSDPGTVLEPVVDDETPPDGGGGTPLGEVLDPVDTPGEEYPIDGNGTVLQQLLGSETDATTGVGFLGSQITDTVDTELGDGDDFHALADDGLTGTGEGSLDLWDGTPLIETPGDLEVVDGGAGDDTITTGDGAAYVFGGEGDDTISVGEGTAAVFGGEGADSLTGSDNTDSDGSYAAYLDGGAGNDVIQGGDANEILEGGEHLEGGGEAGDDLIDGGGGDDLIRGGYGADTLSGGDGDDVIDHLGNAEERVSAEQHEFAWHIDNEADSLDGGAGNDTLIIDRADTATGGEGNDVFWLYFDEASGASHAEVTDFEPGQDFLRVSLNPDLTHGDLFVEVAPSADGADGVVTVNGDVVAILNGAPDATAADVYVEVREDVFR